MAKLNSSDPQTAKKSAASKASQRLSLGGGSSDSKYLGNKMLSRAIQNKAGLSMAVLFFWISLAPSILPRPWWAQSLLGGVMLFVGWMVGYTLRSILIFFAKDIELKLKLTDRSVNLIKAFVVAFSFYSLWQSGSWQFKLSRSIGVQSQPLNLLLYLLLIPTLSLVVFLAFMRLSLFFRGLILGLKSYFIKLPVVRRTPAKVRSFLGYTVIFFLLFQMSGGAFHLTATRIGNRVFSVKNRQTPLNLGAPTSNLVTGGPDSAVSWDDLGRQGKKFVALPPTLDDLKLASKDPNQTMQPIRIYSNLDPTKPINLKAQVDLTMQEMQRTGAWQRKTILLVITTGTGWVDTENIRSLEYLTNGDIATVAIQYSYYPSWLSLMTDREKAQQASQELFSRVDSTRSTINQAERPRLLLFGESLGSYGAESIFKDPQDLVDKVDGAVFVGPPGFNRIFNQVVESKSNPFNDSKLNSKIAIITKPEDYADLATSDPPKIFYLTNPTDPIGVWSPSLIWQNPERFQKNSFIQTTDNRWIPIATFFQTSVDLISSPKVPAGFGHIYGSAATPGWELILQ